MDKIIKILATNSLKYWVFTVDNQDFKGNTLIEAICVKEI